MDLVALAVVLHVLVGGAYIVLAVMSVVLGWWRVFVPPLGVRRARYIQILIAALYIATALHFLNIPIRAAQHHAIPAQSNWPAIAINSAVLLLIIAAIGGLYNALRLMREKDE